MSLVLIWLKLLNFLNIGLKAELRFDLKLIENLFSFKPH